MNPKVFTLLNANTSRVDGMGGGRSTLTVDDLNFACGCADKAGVEILINKYANLRTPQTTAFYGLYREVAALAVRFNWKIREKPIEKLRGLLQLAIFQVTSVLPCPECKGTCQELDEAKLKPIPCRECRGTGSYQIEPLDIARVIGISRQAWYKSDWDNRYREIKILVETKERKALNKIAKKLRNGLDLS